MNNSVRQSGTVASCIVVAALSAFAFADGERDLTEKTGHVYVSNVSEAVIDSKVSQGYRMFDIEVVSTGPHRYSASFVKNSGPYAADWWWTANKSEAGMKEYLVAKGTRIIDLETYWIDGKRKYAFTTVENGERNHKDWWWFAGKTWDEMNDFVALKGGRLIDVDVEKIKGKRYYSGVLIKNTGADQKSWLVFSNISSKQVKKLISTDRGELRMRLVDLERLGNDRFAGILQQSEGQAWWWFTNRTWDDVKRLQGQYGSRIIDIERNVSANKTRFDILLINNANALEWRVGNFIRGGSDGTKGFLLKEVGGSTRGSILPNFRTYPASTIKVLEHYYWSNRIGMGTDPLTQVPLYTNHTSDTHVQSDIAVWQSLQLTMQQMMRPSNNQAANALQEFAGNGNGATGRTNINNFAWNTLGLTDDIEFHHKFADGNVANDPYNIFSMRQISGLYENFANGTALNITGWNFFRTNMLNESGVGGSAFGDGVQSVMLAEGDAIGMDAAKINAVFGQIQLCWKGGNVTGYRSSAGWIRLPYWTGAVIEFKEFVVASFIDDFTSTTQSSQSGLVLPEILRDELAAMLETWK